MWDLIIHGAAQSFPTSTLWPCHCSLASALDRWERKKRNPVLSVLLTPGNSEESCDAAYSFYEWQNWSSGEPQIKVIWSERNHLIVEWAFGISLLEFLSIEDSKRPRVWVLALVSGFSNNERECLCFQTSWPVILQYDLYVTMYLEKYLKMTLPYIGIQSQLKYHA